MPSSCVGGLLESAEANVRAAVARDISLIQAMPTVGPSAKSGVFGYPPVVGTLPLGSLAAAAAAATGASTNTGEATNGSGLNAGMMTSEVTSFSQDGLIEQIQPNTSLETPSELPLAATVVTAADQAEVAHLMVNPARLPSINEEFPCVEGDAFAAAPKFPQSNWRCFPRYQGQPGLTSVNSALGPIPRATDAPPETWIHCWVTQVSDLLEHFSNEINRVRERIDVLERGTRSYLDVPSEGLALAEEPSDEKDPLQERCWLLEDRLVEVFDRSNEEFREELKAEREKRTCEIAQLWKVLGSHVDKVSRQLPSDGTTQNYVVSGDGVHFGRGQEASPSNVKVADASAGSLHSCYASLGSDSTDLQSDRFKKAAGCKWAAISEDLSELRTRLREQLSRSDQGTPVSTRASSTPVLSPAPPSGIYGCLSGSHPLAGSKLADQAALPGIDWLTSLSDDAKDNRKTSNLEEINRLRETVTQFSAKLEAVGTRSMQKVHKPGGVPTSRARSCSPTSLATAPVGIATS